MPTIKNISISFPENFVNNFEIDKMRPKWNIKRASSRTGVEKRGICKKNETVLDLSIKAANKIFEENIISAEAIDGIIFCTQSADYIMPNNASLIHGKFNFSEKTMAFDINLACSGFPYSIGIASNLIKSESANDILLFCGDTYSKLMSPGDRSTNLLFGDGVACIYISKENGGLKLIDSEYYTSGVNYERFILENGGARNPIRKHFEYEDDFNQVTSDDPNFINMDGVGILSFFNSRVPKSIISILKKNNLNIDDIKYFIPHQASKIAVESIRKRLKIDDSKFYFNIKETGNLTSASIPLALSQLLNENKIVKGDNIICCGFGVGLSWATSLLRYE